MYSSRAGFSVVELVIALALFGFLAAIGVPIGLDAYRHYLLDSESKSLLSVMRRAEYAAMTNAYQKSYGVVVQPTQFLIFQGASFASRDPLFDEAYLRNSSISVVGPGEIVFRSLSGLPTVIGALSLSNGFATQTVTVNEQGMIVW
ncbi:prepilin-type N-terminal cleavage/methylation domain-containing protein [Candidatus Jorgensenbacteria bacterium]|nr:prepilin-type N-terminal cleavage/methylation domain-containing protein [Candidatus Jorgensenbacteria bacterium]